MIRRPGGVLRLCGESRAELGRAVLRGHHEEIVKCHYLASESRFRESLIQSMEDLSGPPKNRIHQELTASIPREGLPETPEVTMRAIVPVPFLVGTKGCNTPEDLLRVNAYSRKIGSQAIGGVKRYPRRCRVRGDIPLVSDTA